MRLLKHSRVLAGVALQTTTHRAITKGGLPEGANKRRSRPTIGQADVSRATIANKSDQNVFKALGRAERTHGGGTEATPPALSSSVQWVERTLHYDAAKVQHLANVFSGVEAAKERPRTAVSVEQQLHRPQQRDSAVATARDREKGDGRIARSRVRRCSATSASATNAIPQGPSQKSKAFQMSTLASALLALAPSSFTGLAHDLVRVHMALNNSSTGALPQGPSSNDAAEVLTSLLDTSRLAHYMKDPCAAPIRLSSEDMSSAASTATLHALSILASAFEASIVAFRRASVAVAPEARTAPPGKAERQVSEQKEGDQEGLQTATAWCRERVCAYIGLLTEFLHAFTAALSALASPSLPASTATFTRIDLLLLAVFSLMKAAEVCAYSAGMPPPTDRGAPASVNEFSPERVADQLQRLCLQTSVVLSRLSSPSVTRSLMSCKRQLVPFYAPSSFLLLRQQEKKLLMQMRVVSTEPAFAGCVSALQSMMLVYAVSILTCGIAVERATMKAGSSDAARSSNGEVPARLKGAAGAHLEGDAAAPRCLTEDEKVRMARYVEKLWAEIKPGQVISAAEMGHLQHRTVHTALNVSLATWWRAAARASVSSSPPRPYWNQRPDHIAILLCCYIALLAECRATLPTLPDNSSVRAASLSSTSTTASPVPPNLAWFVPFHSRLIRVGLDLQLEATVRGALHLGIEPRAPPTPETPIMMWVASRRAQRLRRRGAPGTAEEEATPGEVGGMDASWARVYRLCGGVRVAATELLYCAIAEVCCRVKETPLSRVCGSPLNPPQQPSKQCTPSAAVSTTGHHMHGGQALASALVSSVSRMFFSLLRVQYLFGYYTDATYTNWVAEEECRRVYAACIGVLVWLRELAAPFSASVGEHQGTRLVQPSSDVVNDAQPQREPLTEKWQVCGTTSAIALDGAFFFAYFLYHWDGKAAGQPSGTSAGGIESQRSGLDAALASDGVVTTRPCPSMGPLLTDVTAVEYTKEVLFQLQHDTARQLQHLRATDRLHHFTGELRDKVRLLEDSLLRQRHVSSTLSVVQAHCKQPTLLWMPLSQVQEMVFLFHQHPQLFRVVEQAGSLNAHKAAEEGDGGAAAPSDGLRQYANVRVGDITCTFARLHGYLVKRLHVLSGILREYRSILLESSSDGAIGSYTVSEDHSASVKALTPSSLRGWLLENATHSPQLEVHRRNNYQWAHAWAVQLHEEFTRLPSQMEGAARWTSGVMRTLDRMERTMNDTYRQGLFFNVVKSQKQYREVQRACVGTRSLLQAAGAAPVDATEGKNTGEPRVLDLLVVRDCERVPLGVVLDGDARVRRVQMKVLRPATMTDSGFEAEGDLLESPFGHALVQQQHQQEKCCGPQVPSCSSGITDVVGWRVLRVDGNAVSTGREVATQVRGKTVFTITLQSCTPLG
ncbi:hypothetical protein JKF63_02552 [Porcisia hertigi]|uniref:Uncharacterized protein n=1 Tax=Porcisia hertigi TaxID=2761500 RepID=A0A836L2H6_9TRYP|nr:hypothetical protein JKF63_02552 [Porcisia hertigi]